ncbi:Tyrosine-protein phosphatase 10D [Gryllus bimaculatus]|nr:Tyrosine-protein phosphatase 10D [Gryllus bimaculatus]
MALLPDDETRVVLLPFPGEDALASDYINANYVDGYARAKEFIAAQAPTAATAADWWRLVWQERVRVVVALCALREAGLEKCFQYWPSAGGAAAHGPVAVTCAREDAFPDFVVRELRAARGDQTRQVSAHATPPPL